MNVSLFIVAVVFFACFIVFIFWFAKLVSKFMFQKISETAEPLDVSSVEGPEWIDVSKYYPSQGGTFFILNEEGIPGIGLYDPWNRTFEVIEGFNKSDDIKYWTTLKREDKND